MTSHVYWKLVGMGVALTLLISIFSAVSVVLQLDTSGLLLMQIIPFFISASLFTIWIYVNILDTFLYKILCKSVGKSPHPFVPPSDPFGCYLLFGRTYAFCLRTRFCINLKTG